MPNAPEFRQLFDANTNTFTYLLFDPDTHDGVLIDPVLEQVERDLRLITELGVKLKYILETHVHADHVTGADQLRQKTGAQVALGKAAAIPCADILLEDSESLSFGRFHLNALTTPGHTLGCTSYLCDKRLFTGDALMIRGCGRTDFQQGSAESLYQSVKERLFVLPGETQVYPGHDYSGQSSSTIAEERLHNPRLNDQVTKESFVAIMNNLKLDYPRQIEVALPANSVCGAKSSST